MEQVYSIASAAVATAVSSNNGWDDHHSQHQDRMLQYSGPQQQVVAASMIHADNSAEGAQSARDFDVWDGLINRLNNSTATTAGSLHPAADIDVAAVIAALGFNVMVFVVVIGIYEICFRHFPGVYRSNVKNLEGGGIKIPQSPLPLSWIPAIMRVSWGQVRKQCGLDSYFFLRFIRLCFQVTAVSGLWGMVILWPVFATGGNEAHGWYYFVSVDTARICGHMRPKYQVKQSPL